MSNVNSDHWVQTRKLGQYLAFTLLGPGLPMVLALITIPQMIKILGTERFGLLTLIWVLLGYFSLFDFGLGRAASRLYSEKLGHGDTLSIKPIIFTSIISIFTLGLVGTLILSLLKNWLVTSALKVSPALQDEALNAFFWVSLSIPFVSLGGCLKGLLEARQKFHISGAVQALMGALIYIAPLAILLIVDNLAAVVFVLFIARLLTSVIYLFPVLGDLPATDKKLFNKEHLLPLVKTGGWMTVTNIVGPVISYADRFLIAALLTVSFVAYYSTPFEVVTRITLIATAIGQVLFPAMASFYGRDQNRVQQLFGLGVQTIAVLGYSVLIILTCFTPEILSIWLNADFAEKSTMAFRILAFGTLMNMLAIVPFNYLQSHQRANWTALLHLIELGLYLPLLALLIRLYSIEGAAFAWSFRTTIDLVVMMLLSKKDSTALVRPSKKIMVIGAYSLMSFLSVSIIDSIWIRMTATFLLLVIFIFAVFHWLLEPEQKTQLQTILFRRRGTTT